MKKGMKVLATLLAVVFMFALVLWSFFRFIGVVFKR